jgi:hypothetical protein
VVSWVDEGGQRRSAGLGSAAEVAFENVSPAREFLSYRGQLHLPGLWWLATTGRHVGYESWLERDHVMALDFDRDVTGVSSQPFTLSWGGRGRRVSHTPDYFARLANGSGVVVDVRPAERVGPEDAAKFEATAAACAVTGSWSFRLVHELEPVLAANVRWLSGYRHRRHADPVLGPLLLEAFAGGGPLLAGVSQVADPIRGLAERARFWESHILEVITGLPAGAGEGQEPRPEFDDGRAGGRFHGHAGAGLA